MHNYWRHIIQVYKEVFWRILFSVRVVSIQFNDKRKQKFDEDEDIHNYTLNHLQDYSTKQTSVQNENDEEGSRNTDSDDDDEGNVKNGNDANEPAEK